MKKYLKINLRDKMDKMKIWSKILKNACRLK